MTLGVLLLDQFARYTSWFPDIYSVLLKLNTQGSTYLLLEDYLWKTFGMPKDDIGDLQAGNWQKSNLVKGQVINIHQKKLRFSQHAIERMKEREIDEKAICSLLKAYPSLYSRKFDQHIRLLNATIEGRPLSVVTAYKDSSIIIVTAYWKE